MWLTLVYLNCFLRPHEICKLKNDEMKPELYVGTTDRFDINQGKIKTYKIYFDDFYDTFEKSQFI